MPLPEVQKLDLAPDWVAYPFLCMPFEAGWHGTVITDFTATRDPTPVNDRLVSTTLARLPHNLDRAVQHRAAAREREEGRGFLKALLSPKLVHFDDALADVERRANEFLVGLFDSPAPVLRCRRLPQEDWLAGADPIVWEAALGAPDTWFPIDRLGEGHLRYARFAVEEALARCTRASGRRVPSPIGGYGVAVGASHLLIDEPETALHPAAEQRVATMLPRFADRVLVTTHSLEFLDAAQRSTGSAQRIASNVERPVMRSSTATR